MMHSRANQDNARQPREERIARFLAQVNEAERQLGKWKASGVRVVKMTNSDVRKQGSKVATLAHIKKLSALLVADLAIGKVHKGHVLYCRTVVRCMYLSSVSTLVEDSAGILVALQIYNAPGVQTITEAQAWLPEGQWLAIAEPLYKLRTDGTFGVRVDNPKDIFLGVTDPNATPAAASAKESPALPAEERLAALAAEGLAPKLIRSALQEEGFAISEKRVREMLRQMDRRSATDNRCPAGARGCSASATEEHSSATGGDGRVASGSPLQPEPAAGKAVSGVLPIATRVAVQGLESDAGRQLNGQEGSVIGQDLAQLRVHVDLGMHGEKAIKQVNLKVLSAPADPLPFPCLEEQRPSANKLLLDGRYMEAIIACGCSDSSFLTHTMPVEMIDILRASGKVHRAVVAVIEAIVAASQRRQAMNPSALPGEMDNPAPVLLLCDECVAATKSGCEQVDRVVALYLRGYVQSLAMGDWQSAAADYRAAYVASEGRFPGILKEAAWCTLSSTEGLPQVMVAQNYAAAEQMYEVLLHYLAQPAGRRPDDQARDALPVFCLWELAYVCMLRGTQLHPTMALAGEIFSSGPRAPTSLPKAQKLFQRCMQLKDRALAADKVCPVINCLARDEVLDFSAQPEVLASREQAMPAPSPTPTSATGAARQAAYERMREEAVKRMEREQAARDAGDFLAMSVQRQAEWNRMASRFSEEMSARRCAMEARTEALAAQEAESKMREAQLAEQQAALTAAAATAEGDAEALADLYQREKQRQAEDFQASLARLRAQHEAEVADVHAQLAEASRQQQQDYAALLERKRGLELDLERAVGARDAEADRWQREIQDREGNVAQQQQSLRAQAAQLAKMSEDLAAKSNALEEQSRQLQRERKAQQHLKAQGALSQENLGEQQQGPREVLLSSVRYSQDSISSVFRDGRSAEETTRDLQLGKLKPAALPPIRVVQYVDLMWSLDNRRLRCLNKAFASQRDKMKIQVEMVSLLDEGVRAEFVRKFTAGRTVVERGVGRGPK